MDAQPLTLIVSRHTLQHPSFTKYPTLADTASFLAAAKRYAEASGYEFKVVRPIQLGYIYFSRDGQTKADDLDVEADAAFDHIVERWAQESGD